MQLNPQPRRSRFLLGVALAAVGLCLVRPMPASAAWPLPSAARVALGFGATYSSPDATRSSTHRGVDLEAAAGSRVLAPLAGEVTFAGRVPAVGGGTVLAVTISTSKGDITLLPLGSATVKRGVRVAEGDGVGLLGEGDGSCADSHLHVGLKRGDLYVDPLGVMTAPAEATGGEGAASAQPSVRSATSHVAGSGHAPEARGGSSPAAAGARALAGAGTVAGQGAPAGVRAPVAGAQLAPGVSVAGAPVQSQSGMAAEVSAPDRATRAGVQTVSSSEAAPSLAPLLSSIGSFARRSARGASLGLLGVLAALGALWPVWRSDRRQACGKVCVRPVGDDVAAVSGR